MIDLRSDISGGGVWEMVQFEEELASLLRQHKKNCIGEDTGTNYNIAIRR